MTDLEKFISQKCGSPMTQSFFRNGVGYYPVNATAEITLAHVLLALNNEESIRGSCLDSIINFSFPTGSKIIIFCGEYRLLWDLTKNFHEQSLETQQAIAKLLGWER